MKTMTMVGALAATMISTVPPASARELVYGTYVPPQHESVEYGAKLLQQRLPEETNGELTYKIFTGGTMGGAKEALESVRGGVVDSSNIVDIYFRADLPVTTTLSSLLIMPDDPRVYVAAMNEVNLLHCPACEEERRKNRIVGIAWTGAANYYLLCNKPASTLAELEGKKVRAASRMGVLAQSMGAVPVSISAGEIYEALQRGQLDCVLGSAAWLDGYSLKDFVTHIVTVPMGAYFGSILMNLGQDTWEDLTDAQKQAFWTIAPEVIANVMTNYMRENQKTLDEAAQNGVELNEGGADLVALVAEARANEWQAVADEARSQNIAGADEAIQAFKTSVEKWERIIAEIGDDQAAYQKALWDEIFSKM
ncbi:MAG: C4-dicarboxylate TRAP transporter substrate-binding protein [Pseudomonadota bacterium]|nr:C4-dicarboxylate TRAP transporter substrate-binding protein [Pseudomonadota bacterium]